MRKILTAIALLLAIKISAQDSTKTTVLQEIIVSASRTDQVLLDAPRSASVINRDMIEKTTFNSVGELLAAQEGIYVVGGNQTPGTNQSVFLRGANSNQVVVLIDGKRITDPSSPNAAVDLSEISLTDVERIEIIRGSHTSAYGGSAIGGVINIITKRNHSEGLRGMASLQGGTFGNGSSTFTEQVDAGYSFKNGLYVNAALWQQNVTGLDATLKNSDGGFSTYDKDDFRKTDVAAKAGYKKDAWDAYAGFKRINQKAEIDNGANWDDDNNSVSLERSIGDYLVKYSINDSWSISGLGGVTVSQRINENDSSVIDENGNTDKSYSKGVYDGKIVTMEFQSDYIKNGITALLGTGLYNENMFFDTYYYSNAFGFPYESAINYDSIDSSTRTMYFFGKVAYDLNNFNIALGGRFSNHSLFRNYVTFELNPSYKLRNGLIYASVSSGYNPPSLYQLYDPSLGFGAYTSRGNRKLKPEESMSFEVGIKRDFTTGSYITVSAYRTSVRNSIEYIYLWDGNTAVNDLDYSHYRGDTYVNSATQIVSGIEAGGNVRLSQRLSLSGNISLLRGEVEISKDDIDPEKTGPHHIQLFNYGVFLSGTMQQEDLVRRPDFLGNAQLTYLPVKAFSVTAAYRHAGSRFDSAYDPSSGPYGALKRNKITAYDLFDITFNYKLNSHFSFIAKVENILDEEYSEIEGYATRGRSIYGRIVFKI